MYGSCCFERVYKLPYLDKNHVKHDFEEIYEWESRDNEYDLIRMPVT